MWIITKKKRKDVVHGALRLRGAITLYFTEEACKTAHKLFLNRETQAKYEVKPVDVNELKPSGKGD